MERFALLLGVDLEVETVLERLRLNLLCSLVAGRSLSYCLRNLCFQSET